MKILGICGLGGSGKEILDLVERVNVTEKKWEEFVFIDKSVNEPSFLGCKVYAFEEIQENIATENIEFAISVGDVYLREKIYNQIVDAGYYLATIVAPGVNIPKSSTLGQGVIVRDNVFVSVDVNLENNVMIQPNAVVGHDVNIGKHSVVSSQSVVAGGVKIGENTYIALGCMIKELVQIGSDTIVSMGTIVNKNIESNVVVRGNPVEVVSKNYLKSAFRLNSVKVNG